MKVSAIAFALLAATASAKKTDQASAEPTVRELMSKIEDLSKDLTAVNSKLADERTARKELASKLSSLEKAAPKQGHSVRRRAEEAELPEDAPEEIGYGGLLSKILYLEEAITALSNCVDYSEYGGYATCTFGDDYNDVGVKILADTKIEMYADNNIKMHTDYGAIDLHAKNNINLDSDYGSVTVHAKNDFTVDVYDEVTIKGFNGVSIDSGYGNITLGAYGHLNLHADDNINIDSYNSIHINAGYGYYDHVKIGAGGDVGLYSSYGDIYGVAKYGDIDWYAFYNVFLTADYGNAPMRLGPYFGKGKGKVEKEDAIAANVTFVDPESTAEMTAPHSD